MAITRKTRPEHLYALEEHLDQITGTNNHENKLNAAFARFLIDFEADTADPDNVKDTSSDKFIWPVAYLTLHLYYKDLTLSGRENVSDKAADYWRDYQETRRKVKFETTTGTESAKTNRVRLVR